MDSPSHIIQQAQGSCFVHTHGSQSHKGFVHSSLAQSIPTIFPPKHLALARIPFSRYIIRNDNNYIHMNHIYLSHQYQQNWYKSFHNAIHAYNFCKVSFNHHHIIRNDNSHTLQFFSLNKLPNLVLHVLKIHHNEIHYHNFYNVSFSLHL